MSSSQPSTDQPQSNGKSWEKSVYGVLIMIGVAVSWTGATQFSESSINQNQSNFYAPYFMVWFSTNLMLLCWPVSLVLKLAASFCQSQNEDTTANRTLKSSIRTDLTILSSDRHIVLSVLLRVIPFLVLWTASNYSYVQALGHVNSAVTTTVFSSNTAIVYVLSFIFLREKITVLKVLAVVFSMCGISCTAVDQGFKSVTLIGVFLALLSSICASIYKVAFKKLFNEPSLGQVSLFMSCLGVANVLINGTVVVILWKTNTEILQDIPWSFICISAVLSLAFNFLLNYGVAYVNPLFVSVGFFLGIPINAVFDTIVRHVHLGWLSIVGCALILIGFALLLLPEPKFCTKHNSVENIVHDKRDSGIAEYQENRYGSCEVIDGKT